MDYSKLSEITVTNQEELDAVPDDFKGNIYIKCTATVSVRKRYRRNVVARDNSSVVAFDNSSVKAWDNSSVEAFGNSLVKAFDNSLVKAFDNSSVVAFDNSSVVAFDNSSVEAWDNSSVVAHDNSSVEAWDNSSVVAHDNSSVEAWGNVQVVNRQINGKIKLSGNARQVFMPRNIHEFLDYYGVKHTEKAALLYKAVHKNNNEYFSYHDKDFRYVVGETVISDCDPNIERACSHGLHIACMDWALCFGGGWDDLAILEVETDIADIVMPSGTDGKVRTSKLKVIREVPLEECGVYGKILAKRRTQ